MGAYSFETFWPGTNVAKAFEEAKAWAQYEHGHGGYTGTIAEKQTFRLFYFPVGVSYEDLTEWLSAQSYENTPEEHRDFMRKVFEVWDDKWGPACAVECPQNGHAGYMFFGHASS